MRSFEEYVKLQEELDKKQNLEFKKNKENYSWRMADSEDCVLFCQVFGELCKEIKLPNNRYLVLQSIADIKLEEFLNGGIMGGRLVLRLLLNRAAITSGLLADIHDKDRKVWKYAMEGGAGYSDLIYGAIKTAIENEKKGIDHVFQEENENHEETGSEME